MSLEDQITSLNQSIKTLDQSVLALAKAYGSLHTKVDAITSIEGAEVAADQAKPNGAAATTGELGTQGVAEHITDEPQVTLKDLGAMLAGVANKYGAPAQDAIKQIVLETGGTQALSQVDPVVLPIIAKKVAGWVAGQPVE